MKKLRKGIAILLFVAMIISSLYLNDFKVIAAGLPHYENAPVQYELYSNSNDHYYDYLCTEQAGNLQLPKMPNSNQYVPARNKDNQLLNYRLWVQQGLVVYGTAKNVSGNRFKPGYQIHHPGDPKPTEYSGDGYYLKDGVRGEYQYHGYDVTGNRFSNIAFINDANVTTFNGRMWIKEPWNTANRKKTGLTEGMSLYNQVVYDNPPYGSNIRQWINNTLKGWNQDGTAAVPYITSYTDIGDPTKVYYDPDVYKYLYVQSPPTITRPGQGRMWHQRPTKVYYQSFSIPVLKYKLHPQVTCDLTADPYPNSFYESAYNKPYNLNVHIKGILNDQHVFEGTSDDVAAKKTVYYNRADVAQWKFTVTYLGKEQTIIQTANKASNECLLNLNLNVTYKDLDDGFFISATAEPIYDNKSAGNKGSDILHIDSGTIEEPDPIDNVVVIVPTLDIGNDIPEIAFDNIPFEPTDNTDMSLVSSTEVYVGGEEVDYDEFFSGNYIFPRTTGIHGYLTTVEVIYHLDTNAIITQGVTPEARAQLERDTTKVFKSVDIVFVYPTKPHAHFEISSNTWKENRIINVENDSPDTNIQIVMEYFPIVQYRWYYGGDTTKLHFGTNTDLEKQLQYSKAGRYSITLEAMNTLGQWSDPYTCEFSVLEDYGPVIEANLDSSVVTRQDKISAWHYGISSTDGDKISSAKIELWYDNDNNGVVDTKLREWNGLGSNSICEKEDFPAYTPDKLGYYVYRIYANEEFICVAGQDTLSQYVSSADKKKAYYEVEWWVDNYQPLSDIYIDAPIERPNVDLFVMLDKNLNDTKRKTVMDDRVNYENYLLGQNIIPNINIWDMKTYTFSQPASKNHRTGKSYPPETLYYESNGYSGILTLIDADDNGEYVDNGEYKYRTEKRTFSRTHTNVCTTKYSRSSTSDPWQQTYNHESSPAPSSKSINEDGYSGSIPRTSTTTNYRDETVSSDGLSKTIKASYTAHYEGTLSKQVKYWDEDLDWVADYTGSYSGTIYKEVRQPYTDPYQGDSIKFILYLSDSTVNELADLNSAKSKADEKLILAGTSGIKSQSSHDLYINVSGKTVTQVMNEALEYIAQSCPDIEQYYVLPGQTFTLNFAEYDLEGDSIVDSEIQYVHERNYFDNPTGQEANTLTAFNPNSGWTDTVRNKFMNVGKYRIFRRVKDLPGGANGDDYSYYSGATEVNIYVHRKPIAEAILDWKYNSATGQCDTVWIDKSFDLDHTSQPDKGIVERKIMFRRNGGEWQYYIPSTLTHGTYDVQYFVKDVEGVWSEPWLKTFTLDGNPQFSASLRPVSSNFTLLSIPASETLQAYNLWTRQPSPVRLEFSLTPTVSGLPATKIVTFQSGVTGTQAGQDITWVNQNLKIPESFPDGPRTFTALARDLNSGSVTSIPFTVNVSTPINIVPGIAGNTFNNNQQKAITASTTKYPSTTTVQMQYGTSHASTVMNMTGTVSGNTKSWTVNYTVPNSVPDGTYIARFVSTNPSGKQEVKTCTYSVVHNRPPTVSIVGISPSYIYEGDDVTVNFNVSDPDLDILTCDITIKRGTANVWTGSKTVSPSSGTYSMVSLPSVQNITSGTYTVEITTRDPRGMTDSDSRSFTVNTLSISGAVSHTPDWEINRQKYNDAAVAAGRPTRTIDTYFAGEKYLLKGTTTAIDPRSTITVLSVNVTIAGHGYSTALVQTGSNIYTGSLWDDEMLRWTDGPVDFVFEVTYSNGTVKTDTVRTNIVDDEYWRLHRLF